MLAPHISVVNLGCRVNRVESDRITADLMRLGFAMVEPQDAELIVINTCAFIESAKQEAIDNILDVAWLKENHTLRGIVVTGCLPERYREQLLEEMPEVDCILGTGSYGDICEAVRSAYAKKPLARFGDVNAAPLGGERVVTTQEHFAYLQIAEGCDNRCSYCVIPSIRGRFRSRPMGEIVEEARELAALGVRELCLVAQDTTRYGEDLYGTYALDALLRELSAVDGIRWLRLLYCYPGRITDGLVEEIASNPKVVKYIDMPIQHISDRVLRAMNRPYTRAGYLELIRYARRVMPELVLTSDVIIGFPGETESEAMETVALVEKVRFDALFTFIFSPRPGTPAAKMEDPVPREEKQRWFDRLCAVQNGISEELHRQYVGQTLRCLVDGESDDARWPLTARTAGGRLVHCTGDRADLGEYRDVKITDSNTWALFGTIE